MLAGLVAQGDQAAQVDRDVVGLADPSGKAAGLQLCSHLGSAAGRGAFILCRYAGMIAESRISGQLFTRGAWRDSVVGSILSGEFEPHHGSIVYG